MGWGRNSLVALDQFVNAALSPVLNVLFGATAPRFGDPDETISSVLGKMKRNNTGNKFARIMYRWLNNIEADHCEKSIEQDEGSDA